MPSDSMLIVVSVISRAAMMMALEDWRGALETHERALRVAAEGAAAREVEAARLVARCADDVRCAIE